MKLAVFVSLLVILPLQAEARSCVGKNVDVLVVNGRDLTGDGLGYPDPYVLVTIGSETQRTRVIHSDDDPSWYQKFQFRKVTSGMMKIDVWEADSGLRGDDDHLGTCMENMSSGSGRYVDVKCTVKDNGYVNIKYTCY